MNKQKCLYMWRWLANNSHVARKIDYFYEHEISNVPVDGCYACKEVMQDCSKCPVHWPKLNVAACYNPKPCEESYYGQWCSAKSDIERKAAALGIICAIEDTWEDEIMIILTKSINEGSVELELSEEAKNLPSKPEIIASTAHVDAIISAWNHEVEIHIRQDCHGDGFHVITYRVCDNPSIVSMLDMLDLSTMLRGILS